MTWQEFAEAMGDMWTGDYALYDRDGILYELVRDGRKVEPVPRKRLPRRASDSEKARGGK